jgi:hypothetical protein
MLFIGCANKSYTFNPDLLQLVPDITKIPKLLPFNKASIIHKWNPKWTPIAQMPAPTSYTATTSLQLLPSPTKLRQQSSAVDSIVIHAQ